jgi:polar amino acid transport system substrate-binding protein
MHSATTMPTSPAGLIRDVGMVGEVGRIAREGRELTAEERRVMQEHPVRTAEALRSWERFDPTVELIALVVRHHHERWDGSGTRMG